MCVCVCVRERERERERERDHIYGKFLRDTDNEYFIARNVILSFFSITIFIIVKDKN